MRPRHSFDYKDVTKGAGINAFLKFQDEGIERIRLIQQWGTNLKFGVPLRISAKLWSAKYMKSVIQGLVVIPFALNRSSIRCSILASEEDVFEDLRDDSVHLIKFRKIVDMREWTKEEAPLIVNWGFISPEFKRELFGTGTQKDYDMVKPRKIEDRIEDLEERIWEDLICKV